MSEREKISEVGEEALDEAAIARISERVAAEGPRVMRRARQVRVVKQIAGAVVVIATAVWMWRLPERSPAPESVVVSSPAPSRQCEAWDPPRGIGERAKVELDAGSELSAAVLEPCRMVLALARGKAIVGALELGGGELIVETPIGSARVVGTRFAIEVIAGRFAVEVFEGEVEVATARAKARVRAGTRVSGELLLEESAVAAERVLPPRPQAKKKVPVAVEEEDADELVQRASELRKRGELDRARALYRRAGALRGATAEAAWIALARLELAEKRSAAALEALDRHARRFPGGDLEVEAKWLRVELVDREEAKKLAEEIIERWPDSAQAKAARRWLDQGATR